MPKDGSADGLTTLSTRFSSSELKTLREAADLRQWSLSQLIRSAANEKAVSIINANSPVAYRVRALLGRIIEQLFSPKILVENDDLRFGIELNDENYYVFGIPDDLGLFASTLDGRETDNIYFALAGFGAELAQMFRDEHRRFQSRDKDVFDLDGIRIPPLTSMAATETPTEAEDPSKQTPKPTAGKKRPKNGKRNRGQ